MQKASPTRNNSPEVASATIGNLITIQAVARNAAVSVRTAQKWAYAHKIPYIKIGRTIRFRWPAVEAALLKFERKAVS